MQRRESPATSSRSSRSARASHAAAGAGDDDEDAHVYKGSTEVRLSNRSLGAVPPFVMDKGDMRLLDLSSNKLTLLPNMLVWRSEVSLRSIFIQNNLLVALPPEICRCQTLQDLRVSNNQLALLPEALGTLDTLTRLDVQGNRLVNLPPSLSCLIDLRVLNLSRNLLRGLPEQLAAPLTALTDLNVDANRLSSLPLALAYQRQLRFLRASANRIEQLEVDVATLPALEELHMADNLLRAVPAHCWNKGQGTRLVALDLSGNQLTDIPSQLALLQKLRVFGLARNPNLPIPLLEASYRGAESALAYLDKIYQHDLDAHAAKHIEEEEDVGDSIARLDAMRRAEKEERMHRLQETLASNNNGVGAFYKAIAGLAAEGVNESEIAEFRGRLAHRMLHEFEHEGYSAKAMKKQQKAVAKPGAAKQAQSP